MLLRTGQDVGPNRAALRSALHLETLQQLDRLPAPMDGEETHAEITTSDLKRTNSLPDLSTGDAEAGGAAPSRSSMFASNGHNLSSSAAFNTSMSDLTSATNMVALSVSRHSTST